MNHGQVNRAAEAISKKLFLKGFSQVTVNNYLPLDMSWVLVQ